MMCVAKGLFDFVLVFLVIAQYLINDVVTLTAIPPIVPTDWTEKAVQIYSDTQLLCKIW
jgi:hypothetical protein